MFYYFINREESKKLDGFISEGDRVSVKFITFVEACKLMAKAPQVFLHGILWHGSGKKDYALMLEIFLVKSVQKIKSLIS